MKKLIFISLIYIFFYSCASSQVEEEPVQKYYFYFKENGSTMNKYLSYKGGPIRYWYKMRYADNLIFTPYNSIEKKIKIKNLKNYKVKDYNWLIKLNNTDVWKYIRSKGPKKEFYLIEERKSNKVLYLRRVTYILEYD